MFKAMILQELKRRGWSAYRLGKESGMSIRTCQAYVAGERDLTGGRLAVVCKTLGLELHPARRTKGR